MGKKKKNQDNLCREEQNEKARSEEANQLLNESAGSILPGPAC